MEQIRHHLSDDLLMGYSAGTLPEAFSLVVATHISLCDDCRAHMETLDAVGGVVLDRAESARMSESSFTATLALISKAPQIAEPSHRPVDAVLPAPLQDYVGGDLNDVNWKKLGGGVSQCLLETSREATVRLLHIPAGMKMPDHGHHGTELTLVLKGAFLDGDERFARGDIEIADEDMNHTPVADLGEDCICLAASDARLKFNTLLPRMAQPFIGI